MAFNEFCCRSGGSNMNGGHIASNGEPATGAVYSATNGGWNSATGVFTPTSGNPSLSITVGDYANVFTDGSTTPVFIGRVTAVGSTTVTVSVSVKAGTAPTTAASGISINVGGAWAGPSGTTIFPVGFIDSTAQDASSNAPRVNFKNDQSYVVSVSLNHTKSGLAKFQGYTTTFGDGGKATVDGGTSGASYILFNINNVSQIVLEDIVFQNNGATGSASLVAFTTAGNANGMIRRCVFAHSRGIGLELGQSTALNAIECEAYDCNQSNAAALGGFAQTSATGGRFIRCVSHDHSAGSNCHGFSLLGNVLADCIVDTCAGSGFWNAQNGSANTLIKCDAYNCAGDGIKDACGGGRAIWYVENCNLVKNGGYGINFAASGATLQAIVVNCGFGSGTQANTSGQTNLGTLEVEIIGSVSYGSGLTPWVDPANGDFRINLAAAKNAGRGSFTQTAASYAGAIGYPDIGSNQHLDAGGGAASMLVHPGMTGGIRG